MLAWFKKRAPIRKKFDVMIIVNVITAGASVAAMAQTLKVGNTVIFTLGIACVSVPVLVLLYARQAICTPFVDTVVRMEGLAAGDLAGPIHYTDHADCVGRLTRAMSVFRKNAEDVIAADAASRSVTTHLGRGLSRLAERDLTCRLSTPFEGGYDQLRLDYNLAMDAMGKAMGVVSAAAEGISTGAAEIRQASDDLSQRTEQQAASLEQTTASMDEITGTVKRTAEQAARADAIVGATRVEAEASDQVVRRAVDAMGGIERTSNEISEIIAVIDGIAFQTNLLALNAGVEAARAGDAGKGFAVVASEVRALAQRSAEAAKDVKARITASTEQVDVGVTLVSETGSALRRIIGRIAEIHTLVSDMAGSAEHQAKGLQQINIAVGEMDSVTQQNAAMVEQATAAARSLATEADGLAREVSHFQLTERQGRPRPTEVTAMPEPAPARVTPIRRAARGNAAVAVAADDWSSF